MGSGDHGMCSLSSSCGMETLNPLSVGMSLCGEDTGSPARVASLVCKLTGRLVAPEPYVE